MTRGFLQRRTVCLKSHKMPVVGDTDTRNSMKCLDVQDDTDGCLPKDAWTHKMAVQLQEIIGTHELFDDCRGLECSPELLRPRPSSEMVQLLPGSPAHRNHKNPGAWRGMKYDWWYCGPDCGPNCCGAKPERPARQRKATSKSLPLRMHVPSSKISL